METACSSMGERGSTTPGKPLGNPVKGTGNSGSFIGEEEAGDCGMAVDAHDICAEQGHTSESLWFRKKRVALVLSKEVCTTDSNYKTQEESADYVSDKVLQRGNCKEFLLINTSIFTNS